MLLTFAQFEREIMADRIRDKRRQLRQSGHWGGGLTPLGYCVRKQVLHVVPSEAKTVRFLFKAFARLGNYEAVSRLWRGARLKGHCRKDSGSRGSAHYSAVAKLEKKALKVRNGLRNGAAKSS